MGNWNFRLDFYNYLQNDVGLNANKYVNTNATKTNDTNAKKDISFNIFENEHYVHEYVTNVMGETTNKTIKMEDLLKMDVVDGQLVTEEEKKAKEAKEAEKAEEAKKAEEKEKTNETEETKKTEKAEEKEKAAEEEGKAKEAEENKKEEKSFSFKEIINKILEQKEVIEILDTDKNGTLDKSEVEKFLKRLNVIDAINEDFDKENLSMKEVFDGLIDIAQKEFQVQTNQPTNATNEEQQATQDTGTNATTNETTPAQADNSGYVDNSGALSSAPAASYDTPIGGNGGYSGSNGYSGSFDNQGNFYAKTTDITKMTKAELTQKLQTAETTANDKKAKLTAVQNGTDSEIKALKDAIETAYNEYLKKVEEISKEKAEKLNELKTAVDDAQKAYDDKEIEITKAETAENEAKNNLENAENALAEAKARLDSMNSIDTSKYTPEKLAEFNNKISELKALIAQKEEAKTQAQNAYEEAKKQKEALIKERDEVLKKKLDDAKKALSDFEQKLLEEHPELKAFQQKHEQAKQDYETKKAAKIESLKTEVKTAEDEVLKIKAEIAKRDTSEELSKFSSVQYSEELIKRLQTNHKINVSYDKNGNMYLHYNWARYNEGKIQPELNEALRQLEEYALSKGYVIVRSDGERTCAESNAGRAKKGGIVCKGGNSPHNYGAAADLTVFKENGQQVTLWDTPDLVAKAKELGLDWGGNFDGSRAKYEGHHVQLKNWKSRFKNSANLVG